MFELEVNQTALRISKKTIKMSYEKLKLISDLRRKDSILTAAQTEVRIRIERAKMELELGS